MIALSQFLMLAGLPVLRHHLEVAERVLPVDRPALLVDLVARQEAVLRGNSEGIEISRGVKRRVKGVVVLGVNPDQADPRAGQVAPAGASLPRRAFATRRAAERRRISLDLGVVDLGVERTPLAAHRPGPQVPICLEAGSLALCVFLRLCGAAPAWPVAKRAVDPGKGRRRVRNDVADARRRRSLRADPAHRSAVGPRNFRVDVVRGELRVHAVGPVDRLATEGETTEVRVDAGERVARGPEAGRRIRLAALTGAAAVVDVDARLDLEDRLQAVAQVLGAAQADARAVVEDAHAALAVDAAAGLTNGPGHTRRPGIRVRHGSGGTTGGRGPDRAKVVPTCVC